MEYSRFSKIYWLVTEQNISGNMVTVMSPDGKPIQVNASALQSAGSQNNIGMIQLGKMPQSFETELSICQKEGSKMKGM